MNTELNNHRQQQQRNGRIFGGLIVVAIGVIWLSSKMGIELPKWIYNWELIPITIGLYIGARQSFKGFGWLIPVFIGLVFLLDDLFPNMDSLRPFIWPSVVIFVGLVMIFKPKKDKKKWEEYTHAATNDNNDIIEATSIFGGVNKNIISKQFKGGSITCVFGGAEINLLQADIQDKVTLETVNVFGGTKILVPPHWQIQPEVTAVLGGIEERRPQAPELQDPNKILVLKGTCAFGGIEIVSY